MVNPYLGQVSIFAGNFAPRGWALCEGQLLPINSYSALFSILGTTYGGDGRSTFGLPDLRGRIPMGSGSGPGLSTRKIGQKMGEENHTLIDAEIPSHSHTSKLSVSKGNGTQGAATADSTIATTGVNTGRVFTESLGYNTSTPDTALNSASIAGGNTGGGRSHNNMQPTLCINYVIALEGNFPPRN